MSEAELTRLRNTVALLREATTNEGTHPDHHRRIMVRHRAEWPTLWRIIDLLLEETRGHRTMSEWFCRLLFGMKCTPTENDGRDHDQCGWITPPGDPQ